MMKKAKTSGFACMECGHRFKTISAARKAAFGPKGCPKCGGADIDIASGPLAGAVATVKMNTNPERPAMVTSYDEVPFDGDPEFAHLDKMDF